MNEEAVESFKLKQLQEAAKGLNDAGFFDENQEKISINIKAAKTKNDLATALVSAINNIAFIKAEEEFVEAADDVVKMYLSDDAIAMYVALTTEPGESAGAGETTPEPPEIHPEEKAAKKNKKKDSGAETKPDKKKDSGEAKPKAEKYTRFDAVADAVKKSGKTKLDDIVAEADNLYAKQGGSANPKESRWAANMSIKTLVAFESARFTDDILTLL